VYIALPSACRQTTFRLRGRDRRAGGQRQAYADSAAGDLQQVVGGRAPRPREERRRARERLVHDDRALRQHGPDRRCGRVEGAGPPSGDPSPPLDRCLCRASSSVGESLERAHNVLRGVGQGVNLALGGLNSLGLPG
jgi:hypothetical protein